MSTGWPSKPKSDDSSGTANEIREYCSSQDSPENLDRILLRSELPWHLVGSFKRVKIDNC